MDRTLTGRFFSVEPRKDNSTPFEVAVETLSECELSDRAADTYGDPPIPVWLSEFEKKNGLICGQFTRAQRDNLPFDVRDGNELAPRDTSEIMGIGHSIAFVYHPATRTICAQIDNKAVSLSRANAYLCARLGISGYDFLPILTQEGYERVLSKRNIQSVRMRMAKPENLSAVEPEIGAHGANLANMKKFLGAPYVDVTYTMGRHRGGLNKNSMRSVISELFSRKVDVGLKRLAVTPVKDSDEEREVAVDLLRDQVHYKTTLKLPADDASKNYKLRSTQLMTWFLEKKTWLMALQGKDE